VSDASIIGVAALAAIGAGIFKNTKEGVQRMVRLKDEVKPIPKNVAVYDKIFPIYKDVYYALNDKGVYSKLFKL
jgi:xylulokinase